ncbi:hypothetical protein TNCV_280091 [Trichonephila clavipes]|nr:hypothetical protein TNCV_280091 [Trichonephila clavipes]
MRSRLKTRFRESAVFGVSVADPVQSQEELIINIYSLLQLEKFIYMVGIAVIASPPLYNGRECVNSLSTDEAGIEKDFDFDQSWEREQKPSVEETRRHFSKTSFRLCRGWNPSTKIRLCRDERVSRNEREVTLEKQKIELEELQLAQLEKEIELQTAKNEALSLNPAAKVEDKQFEANIENMIKSIRTLSLPVPTRSENFNLFFQSLERAFLTKKINDEYKSEILINGRKSS